jgi:hypothetical protein
MDAVWLVNNGILGKETIGRETLEELFSGLAMPRSNVRNGQRLSNITKRLGLGKPPAWLQRRSIDLLLARIRTSYEFGNLHIRSNNR